MLRRSAPAFRSLSTRKRVCSLQRSAAALCAADPARVVATHNAGILSQLHPLHRAQITQTAVGRPLVNYGTIPMRSCGNGGSRAGNSALCSPSFEVLRCRAFAEIVTVLCYAITLALHGASEAEIGLLLKRKSKSPLQTLKGVEAEVVGWAADHLAPSAISGAALLPPEAAEGLFLLQKETLAELLFSDGVHRGTLDGSQHERIATLLRSNEPLEVKNSSSRTSFVEQCTIRNHLLGLRGGSRSRLTRRAKKFVADFRHSLAALEMLVLRLPCVMSLFDPVERIRNECAVLSCNSTASASLPLQSALQDQLLQKLMRSVHPDELPTDGSLHSPMVLVPRSPSEVYIGHRWMAESGKLKAKPDGTETRKKWLRQVTRDFGELSRMQVAVLCFAFPIDLSRVFEPTVGLEVFRQAFIAGEIDATRYHIPPWLVPDGALKSESSNRERSVSPKIKRYWKGSHGFRVGGATSALHGPWLRQAPLTPPGPKEHLHHFIRLRRMANLLWASLSVEEQNLWDRRPVDLVEQFPLVRHNVSDGRTTRNGKVGTGIPAVDATFF